VNRLLEAILRADLRSFIRKVFSTVSPGEPYLHNWHIETIAYQLERVFLGETTRLLINQPPRSLKSICASVAYVAWLLGRDPTRRVIAVSYSGDFAAELHRQFRQVASSEWYAALFPHTRWAKETGLEFVTTLGGGRYATSVGGTLTGRGADLIVIDDPLNAAEAQSEAARKRVIDWFGGSLVSRLNDKRTGTIVAVMQRLHEDDLAGHVLRQGGWEHLDLPAIAVEEQVLQLGPERRHLRRVGDVLHPEREGLAALEALKRELGGMMFSAQSSSGRFRSKATSFGEPGSAILRHRPCRHRPIRPRSCKAGTWRCRQAKPTTTQSAPPGAPTGMTFTCSTLSVVASNIPSCGAR
jgi:hypothetical protein